MERYAIRYPAFSARVKPPRNSAVEFETTSGPYTKYDGYVPSKPGMTVARDRATGRSIGISLPARTMVRGTLPSFAIFWTR